MREKNKEEKNKEASIENRDTVIVSRKDTIDIKDGLHKGRICKVEINAYSEYEYIRVGILPTDVTVPKDMDIPILKVGFPLNLTCKSSLGRLITNSGYDITEKDDYTLKDLNDILVGKEISFQTTTVTNENGTFSNVIKDTIKFI